jgi:hypothetical protein
MKASALGYGGKSLFILEKNIPPGCDKIVSDKIVNLYVRKGLHFVHETANFTEQSSS